MTIAVNDSRAVIFLDGQFRGIGGVSLGDLIPGPHHVFVQVPGTGGLQSERDVQANDTSLLDINWQLESMLQLSDRWARIAFGQDLERAEEATLGADLARRFGHQEVVLISTMQLSDTTFIVGTVHPASGEPPIGAFAPVSGGEKLLRALATYLVDGTVAAGLGVIPRGSQSVVPAVAPRAPERRGTALTAKLVAGTGAIATAVGGIIYVASEDFDARRAEPYSDSKSPAVDIMVGGSAILGGGVYLWLRDARSVSPLTAGMLGTGVAAFAAGTALYLTDEDDGPDQPSRIRDTAALGVVTGLSGAALTGAGLWLLHRERNTVSRPRDQRRDLSLDPAVLLGRAQAFLGCTGRF